MRTLLNKIQNIFHYLLYKKSEFKEMKYKDILLIKLVLQIYREKTSSKQIWIPLYNLKSIHKIDRDNAIKLNKKRVSILNSNKPPLLDSHRISKESIHKYMPSITNIKVIQESEHTYVVFEGNSRIEALQQVFSRNEPILIEVECYSFHNPKLIQQQINSIRKLNGLR